MASQISSSIKKVVLLCDFFSSLGGTELYNANLARNLRNKGIEVRIYVGEKPLLDNWKSQLVSDGFFFSNPTTVHKNLDDNEIEKIFIDNVVDEINNWKPDIIHTHPFKKLAIAWLANRKADHSIPIVATEWTVPSRNSSHWFDRDTPKYIHKVNTYIATCNAVKKGLIEYHQFKGNIVKIPHLVNTDGTALLPHTKKTINSVGCISRLSVEKGLVFLIGAWKQVLNNFLNVKLYIYGHGPDKNNLILLRDSLGLKDSIVFAGTYQPKKINSISSNHSIFVQPSLFESIPTSVIELMLNGRVIVASDVGGVSELVKNNYNGMTVEPGNTQQLANGIMSLLSSQDKLKAYSQRAFDDAQSVYNLDKTVNQIVNLYQSILV